MELDFNDNLSPRKTLRVTIRNDNFRGNPRGGQPATHRGNRGGGNRGRGNNYRGRNPRGSMNLSHPRRSANERLVRPPQDPTSSPNPGPERNNNKVTVASDSKIEASVVRIELGSNGCICLRDIQRVFCER